MANPQIKLETKDRFVVAIDFGTTFSGVAFAYVTSGGVAEQIDVVKSWPGGMNLSSEKVPTVFTIDPNGAMKWGLEVKSGDRAMRFIKLLLDTDQDFPDYFSKNDLINQLHETNLTPVMATSQYLSKLFATAKEELVRKFGSSMVSTTRLELILTVPAVWSDKAKDATREAAELAGLGSNLHLISEPEAAAIYALSTMQNMRLAKGDVYVVCDAGGGTVDLICYEIDQVSPLRLREVVPGNGHLAGGAFLNQRFEALVRERLVNETFEQLRQRKPRTWEVALKYFEDFVKRNFDPSSDILQWDDVAFDVPFPGIPDSAFARIDSGFLTMSTAEVAEIFRPLVDKVVQLVESQKLAAVMAGKPAKGVILVGGFGQSIHLLNCLKFRFANAGSADHELGPPPGYTQIEQSLTTPLLQIIQPVNAWTAVVRGAVLRGTESSELVVSRQSRQHYGTGCGRPYNPDIHDERNKYWCSFREEHMAMNQCSWLLKKGANIADNEPTMEEFHLNSSVTNMHDQVDIFVSKEEIAPSQITAETPEDLVKNLCTLDVDLGKVPVHKWQRKLNASGRAYFMLSYHISMEYRSGGLRFTLLVDGVEYGEVRAAFD